VAGWVCLVRSAAVPRSMMRALMWGWFGWVIARCAAVCLRRWWFGRAPIAGFGAVGQWPFRRLLCTWPMVCASRLRRSGLWCVSGFGREFSRTCTG
jgi:hypothetical protein